MSDSDARVDERVRQSLRAQFREAFITGVAVVVPFLITLIVLAMAFDYVYTYIDLLSTATLQLSTRVNLLGLTIGRETLIEVVTPIILLLYIVAVGALVNSTRYGERAVELFDSVVVRIPGIGLGLRVLPGDRRRDARERRRQLPGGEARRIPPRGGVHAGFRHDRDPGDAGRGHRPRADADAVPPARPEPGDGRAPRPPPRQPRDGRRHDGLQGLRTVVTSGVAVSGGDASPEGLESERLRELAGAELAEQQFEPAADSPDVRRRDPVDPERPDRYDGTVSPASRATPVDVAESECVDGESVGPDRAGSERDDGAADGEAATSTTATPAELAGRDPAERDATETTPADGATRAPEHRESTDVEPAAVGGEDDDGDTAGEAPRDPRDVAAARERSDGHDATAIDGHDATAIDGDDATAIDGHDATAIDGDDATAIDGDDATAIDGDDANATDDEAKTE